MTFRGGILVEILSVMFPLELRFLFKVVTVHMIIAGEVFDVFDVV